MKRQQLGREDWIRVARLALLHGGPAAVRIERLAEQLAVTRGSFYWHFPHRDALLEALLLEWEEELAEALQAVQKGPTGISELVRFLQPRILASERGDASSDAAIFAWAASDPAVMARVNAAEEERIAFMGRIAGDPDVGHFLYLAYLGFVMRRRRQPEAAAFFPTLGQFMERVATGHAPEQLDATTGVSQLKTTK